MNHQEAIRHSVRSLSSGQGESAVHSHLLDCGFTPENAEAVLRDALDQVREIKDKQKRKEKLPFRIAGLALCACGIGMMIYSFVSARSGGMYVVPGGLIGYGLYMFATGTGKIQK